MKTLIEKAEEFATIAHSGQTEKDAVKTPYIFHCKKVAELVALSGGSDEEIAAAWLHDVVEDTKYTVDDINNSFGGVVAELVKSLTDLPDFKDLPTKERKQKQAEHIAKENNSVKRIKLADQISAIDLDGHNELFSKEERVIYLEGAKQVVSGCRGVSKYLENIFDEVYKETMDYILQK